MSTIVHATEPNFTWFQVSKGRPPHGLAVFWSDGKLIWPGRGDDLQNPNPNFYWRVIVFPPPPDVKSQEELDNEAAQAWYKQSRTPLKNQMAYPHQLERGWLEKQAFLAGLRHARAQGKEAA